MTMLTISMSPAIPSCSSTSRLEVRHSIPLVVHAVQIRFVVWFELRCLRHTCYTYQLFSLLFDRAASFLLTCLLNRELIVNVSAGEPLGRIKMVNNLSQKENKFSNTAFRNSSPTSLPERLRTSDSFAPVKPKNRPPASLRVTRIQNSTEW